ncbi:MAG: hypothetical protein ACR2GO_03325 [Candidatus Limnocylindria bacterium]
MSDNVGYGYRALEARAWEGDPDAIDDLLAMTGAPGQAWKAAMKRDPALPGERLHVELDPSSAQPEDR